MLLRPQCAVLGLWFDIAHSITQYCHLGAFEVWVFDLALDKFSALSKPISQSQALTRVSGNIGGHCQYQWRQIICQRKHLDKTTMVWLTQRSSLCLVPCLCRNAVSHFCFSAGDRDIIPSSVSFISWQFAMGHHRRRGVDRRYVGTNHTKRGGPCKSSFILVPI